MINLRMGTVESKFADLVWENVPMTTKQLVSMSQEVFGWKKTTTYTVLKRLCDKGVFANNDGTVIALISRNAFYSARSTQFIEDSFSGSLPAFLAAFTAEKGLSQEEVAYLRKMVEEYEVK